MTAWDTPLWSSQLNYLSTVYILQLCFEGGTGQKAPISSICGRWWETVTWQPPRDDKEANGRWSWCSISQIFHPLVFQQCHTAFCQDPERLQFNRLPVGSVQIHAGSLRCHGGTFPCTLWFFLGSSAIPHPHMGDLYSFHEAVDMLCSSLSFTALSKPSEFPPQCQEHVLSSQLCLQSSSPQALGEEQAPHSHPIVNGTHCKLLSFSSNPFLKTSQSLTHDPFI